MITLIALVAGLLFGGGLLLSGMVDPQRVLGFLDVAGHWNPALALTMGGAVAVAAPAFFYVRRHGRTLLGTSVTLPDRFRIDASLLGGMVLKVGAKLFDTSLKSRLNRLNYSLKGAA